MLDAGLFQRGDQGERGLHEGRELVPVLGQFEEGAVALRAVGVPALGMGFEAADHQLARISLDVDATVEVAQYRVGQGQAGHGFGDDVHVLDRLQRERDPRRIGEPL